jgi:transposase-like protein
LSKIIEQIEKLDYAEKIELLGALRSAIAEELAKGIEDPHVCPWCGCPKFVRKGRDPSGLQRWLCCGCARTFSAKSAGLLSLSKLEAATWMLFAECMADALSLRESAQRCKVSLPTAWFMRMRVCEVISYRLEPARVGTFHADETYLVKNLSGNHKRSPWFSMPRKAHRNGQEGRRKNYAKSKERVCIICGINELGDCFCELSNDGAPAKIDISLVLQDRLPKGSLYVTDGHLSYPKDLEGLVQEVIDPKNPLTGNIAMVNSLHARLKDFLMPFHGVAVRRLQRYLDWFCYREQFRKSDADKRALLYHHEIDGRYIHTRSLVYLESRPYQTYWERMVFSQDTRHMSMVV